MKENHRGVRALAPEITLGAHVDLTLTTILCLMRRGSSGDVENHTGCHQHPQGQIDVTVVPSEMELFSGMIEAKLALKGISFLGHWAEKRPTSLYISFCP